jgi:predicted acylesterase/phospholipase RssA
MARTGTPPPPAPSPAGPAPAPAPLSAAPAASEPLRVLALSGGGFLGLYTATVLAGLEERAGQPLGRCFGLLAGTSIGALQAMALAFEIPMQRVVELITSQGPRVFSRRPLPSGAVSRLMDLSRSVAGPKYSGRELREALQAVLGERRLGQALHPVVVPAVDVVQCRTKVFKTPHGRSEESDAELPVVDIILAACAAPAYFPSVVVGPKLYADGGLFAVAPDQIALHEAQHFLGIAPQRVSMLSVGTATARYRPREGVEDPQAGAVGWLADGRLVLTLLSVQQQHVQAMMADRLGARYVRLDAQWPAEAGLGIDVATAEAAQVLQDLARQTLARTPASLLAPFLEPRRVRAG